MRLSGPFDQVPKAAVRIIAQNKYPFKIVDVKAQKGDSIRFDLTEIKQPETAGYLLSVENTKKERGRYFDMIHLKTDSSIQPEIQIRVYGSILDPIKPPADTNPVKQKAEAAKTKSETHTQ